MKTLITILILLIACPCWGDEVDDAINMAELYNDVGSVFVKENVAIMYYLKAIALMMNEQRKERKNDRKIYDSFFADSVDNGV